LFLISKWCKSGIHLVTIWYKLITVPEPSRIYEEWIGGIQLQEEDNVRWIHPRLQPLYSHTDKEMFSKSDKFTEIKNYILETKILCVKLI